jgi:hypothetical protein
MQKASSHPVHLTVVKCTIENPKFEIWNSIWPTAKWTGLLHIVGIWFQVLFHSANSGSFHLSLAVLVHYRLPRSI